MIRLAEQQPAGFTGLILAGQDEFVSGTAPVIQNVNPASPENANTADVILTGTNFGPIPGTGFVTYGEFIALTIVSWSDTEIRCRWPDLVVQFGGMDFNVDHPLSVTADNGFKSSDVQVQTQPRQTTDFAYFTAIDKDPARAAEQSTWDSSTLVLGTDRIYRQLIPPVGSPPPPYDWDDLSLEAEGFYGGVPNGGQLIFSIWDVGAQEWSNTATTTFSVANDRAVICSPAVMGMTANPSTVEISREVNCTPAVMTMTGETADVRTDRGVNASPAVMGMVGVTASVDRGADRSIIADTAIMSLVGSQATVQRDRNVICTPATMAMVGETATIPRPVNRDVVCSPAIMSMVGSLATVKRGETPPDPAQQHGEYNRPMATGTYNR